MKLQKQPIINAIALAITVFINYLSNTGVLNGNTMKTVSDKYHNLFTPAGYAFSIWGLIYLMLAGFVVYCFFGVKKEHERRVVKQVGAWFAISCLINSAWVFAWLYHFTGVSVLLMVALLITLLAILFRTNAERTNPPLHIVAWVWWPFALYGGWISVALIANTAAYLTKIGWTGWGLSQQQWTIAMIVVAGLLNVVVTWRRNLREFALVGAWGLAAVAVANKNTHVQIFTIALITAVIIVVSCTIHAVKNFRGFGRSIDGYERS